ncbi:MAG: CARDB domain-containing protein, partial [bacterium]|nr:CARDB domain-containing protein [bacterium]
MKKFCLFIWFVMFPLFLWGQGLNDGTFDPSNPRDPQSIQLDAEFSWDVLCNRAQFKANSSYKKNIRYEWTLDGVAIGSDAMAVASFLSVGPHKICLKETYAGVTATKEQTFTIEPQANWYLWGDFTYDPSGLGIRNFTTADEAFTMLSEIPISSSISLEFKQACDVSDYLQEHADLFDQLIAHANPDEWYHHEVRFTGNSLKLSNQLEPTLLKNYLKWAKQIRFDCLVLMGSYGFNDSTTPFQQQSLVSGNETTVRDFTQFSTQLNYRWQLTGTPQTTGWQMSGTGSLPSMLIESETFQPDTVVYRIEMMPAGTSEAYAVNEVTYLIYPKRIEHVDFRPAENQVIHDFSSVTFSWQEEWWTQDQTIQKYTFELWEEDKESVKYSRQYYTSNRYVTLNAVDFKFELNKHYCWRIIVHGIAGDMYSDTHHCNTCDMPDLQLSDWTWNIEEVTAGQELTITAKVTNVGTVASEAGQWSDRLYFSWEPVWEENAGTPLMTFPVEGVLEPGAFYQIEKKFTMPVLDKEGVGYFHLVAHSSTLELNMENNRLTSQPVTYRKVEDLRVDDVLIAKNKLIPGESVHFTAKVTNAGTRATTVESWTDKLYVSLDPEFSEETASLLRTYPHEGALPFQDFYTVDETFNMPLLEQEGTYYYYYVADVESAVAADVDRSNNRRKGETTFSYQHVPDLQIASLSVSKQSIKPGESVQISATVTNIGYKATPEVVWQTRLYLSDQPELDTQKARLLTTQEHTGPLAAQASYPVEYTFTLPRLIPGNYYFHWVVDPEKVVTGDPDRTNNQIVSEPVELLALPLDPVT